MTDKRINLGNANSPHYFSFSMLFSFGKFIIVLAAVWMLYMRRARPGESTYTSRRFLLNI